jgi:putative oxidoreductase
VSSFNETNYPAPVVPAARLNAGVTILRLIVGTVFIAHGGQKLFTIGLGNIGGMFGQMGIPMGELVGPAVALLEFFGGIALVLGLFTRLAAVGLALVMAGAVLLVHLPSGFFSPQGIEFPLSLLGALTALALLGPGRFSVDGAVRHKA